MQSRLDPGLERSGIGKDGFRCFREGAGYRVDLWGSFPQRWPRNLAQHCAAAGIEIVSGEALREGVRRWSASFEIRSSDGQDRTPGLDFLAAAQVPPRIPPELPDQELTVSVALGQNSPGMVFAHVEGKDTIGLLAEVLRRFECFDLVPRQFSLHTVEGGVLDWFWLEPRFASESADS